MTESININSLADHHLCLTIKTLPATLPEPSFKVRISSAGFSRAVSASDLGACQGMAADTRAGSCASELGSGIGGGGGG